MHTLDAHLADLIPLMFYVFSVLLVVVGMLTASHLLGERKRRPNADPYEGGVQSAGLARLRMSATFYLVAMFFVIFDLEAVFIYAWAVAARDLGWPGYFAILIFIGVLGVSLAYLWKLGALDQDVLLGRRKVDRRA